MFTNSYFPKSYFPPSYWPKEGAALVGGGGIALAKRKDMIRRLLMREMIEQAERAEARRRSKSSNTDLQEAIDGLAKNAEIVRRQEILTATYSAILSEI